MVVLTMRAPTLQPLTAVLLHSLISICFHSQVQRTWSQRIGSVGFSGRLRLTFDAGNAYNQQRRIDQAGFQNLYGWSAGPSRSSHGVSQRPAERGYPSAIPTPYPKPRIHTEAYLPKNRAFNRPGSFEDDAEHKGNYRNALGNFGGQGAAFRPGGFVGLPGNRFAASVEPKGGTTGRRAVASAMTATQRQPSFRVSRRSLLG